ncbi:hypothetical protein [Gemella morbillorum]|nr:hypothetical protein [Gemella morbillorum]
MGSKEIALLRWVIILLGFLVGLIFNIEANIIFGITLILIVLTGGLEKD